MSENQKCPLDADVQSQRNLTVCSKPDRHHRQSVLASLWTTTRNCLIFRACVDLQLILANMGQLSGSINGSVRQIFAASSCTVLGTRMEEWRCSSSWTVRFTLPQLHPRPGWTPQPVLTDKKVFPLPETETKFLYRQSLSSSLYWMSYSD